jgi:hypothetical protein
MGYLTVLHVRLGANFGDLHAKDSHLFCKRLILGVLLLGASDGVRQAGGKEMEPGYSRR